MPPGKKEEELSFFLVMTTKNCSSLSFYRGPLLSLWTSFELQLKKVNPWVGQKLKFSFCPMNWTLVDFQNSRKKLNLIANCNSTFNCDTALLHCALHGAKEWCHGMIKSFWTQVHWNIQWSNFLEYLHPFLIRKIYLMFLEQEINTHNIVLLNQI